MKNLHLLRTYKEQHSIVQKNTGLLLIQTPRKEYSGTKLNIYITSDEEIKAEDKWVYNIHWNEPQKIEENWILKILNESSNTFKIILATDQDLIKDGVQAIDDEFLEWLVKNPSCEEVKITTYGDYLSLHHSDSFHGVYKIIIPQEEPKQEYLERKSKFKQDLNNAMYEAHQTSRAIKQECTCGVCDNCEEKETTQILKEAKENALKQETLEEVTKIFINKYYSGEGYERDIEEAIKFGANWQQENMPIHILDVDNTKVSIQEGVVVVEKNDKSVRMYSEEEVKKLLIRCKDRFSGSELHDYTSDETVIEYFFAPKT
jgi:hypothetical protein